MADEPKHRSPDLFTQMRSMTAAIPIVTRSVHDLSRASSHAIHRLVEGSVQAGSSIYALDEAALAEARPNLILTQELCRECAVGYREVNEVARRLDGDVTVISLEPTSIEGILNSIQTVGAMTSSEDSAMFVVEGLRERLQAVEEIVVGRRDHGFRPARVAAIGDLAAPSTMGLWVPEQVRLAGGWELLGSEGGPPVATTWAAVREVDPEVLILMPPDLDLPGTIAAWEGTPRPPSWGDLRAVRDGRVFAVDGAAYFGRPGPRVVDGIEVLTELIDPIAFDGMSPPASWERVS